MVALELRHHTVLNTECLQNLVLVHVVDEDIFHFVKALPGLENVENVIKIHPLGTRNVWTICHLDQTGALTNQLIERPTLSSVILNII